MKKTILNIATITALSLSLFSCHKKSEDPTPITPVVPAPTPTPVVPNPVEKKLVFTPRDTAFLSISDAKNIKNVRVYQMVESDSAYIIESVVSSNSEFITSGQGNNTVNVQQPTDVYAGKTVLTITLRSGKRTTTKQINVQYGTMEQIATFKLLKPFFGKGLTGTIGNFYIYSNGNITSNANGNFYGDDSFVGTTYHIDNNGYVVLHTANIQYKVEVKQASGKTYLQLTKVSNGNIVKLYE